MAYSTKVLDHYNNPRNVGSFDQADLTVGTGLVGAPECGDVLKLQIKVNPATGLIEDARFKTFGARRGRHQGGDQELPGEAGGRRTGRGRRSIQLTRAACGLAGYHPNSFRRPHSWPP